MKCATSWDTLLQAPRPCDHFVQLYTDEVFLARGVCAFLRAGFAEGDAAVVIATPAHVSLITERLSAERLIVADLLARDQLLVVDAMDCLSRFMVDGRPDRDRFLAVIGDMLQRARAAGYSKIRLYGEMVNLLWRQNLAGAIRLEELWNEALARERVTLLCAYAIDNFDPDAHRDALPRVTEVHSHLIPVEDYERFEEAVARAYGELFGPAGDPEALREALVSTHASPTAMPPGQAALLALRDIDAAVAETLLRRARQHYDRTTEPVRAVATTGERPLSAPPVDEPALPASFVGSAGAPAPWRPAASRGSRQGGASRTADPSRPSPAVQRSGIVMNGVRVLVVDDDPDVLLMFAYALRKCGADVITVDNARSAFEAALTLCPDVVVSDVAMRERDGYWLVKALRSSAIEACAQVPALAVTAFGETHSRTRVMMAGFQDYLSKPVDPDVLCRAVARLARA